MGASNFAKNFANYEILGPLGEGGMGEVFLARDLELSRKVAIKFINDDGAKNQTLVKRFQNEAKILASLNHPNIVSVYNFGKHEKNHYIVMEYIDGKPLSQVIKSRGFGISEALNVMEKIASAVAETHKNGILHRDIKPSNIIIDRNGVPKLVDFGISKNLIGGNDQLTKTDNFIGSIHYLAPEILYGKSPSPQSDVFSLGIVFYEMIVGNNPFLAESKFEVIEKIKNAKFDVPESVASLLPDGTEDLIYEMTQPSKVRRMKTMDDVIQNIRNIDRSAIPEALLVSRRPEIMILNENKIRLKLLGKGFETREVGIIISLAARYQEQCSGEVPDKTLALDESSKVSISEEALNYALTQFKDVKSQLYDGKKKFGSIFLKKSKRFYSKISSYHYVNSMMLFLILVTFVVGGLLINSFLNSRKDFSDRSAILFPLPAGTRFKTKKVMFVEETGVVEFDSIFNGEILGSENKVQKVRLTNESTGDVWSIEASTNSFVPPYFFEMSTGFSSKTILTGDYNAIFPLEVGKTMNYSYTSVARYNENKMPSRLDEVQCKVNGAKNIETAAGNFFAYEVFCQSTIDPQKYKETYFFSPKLNMCIRKDRIAKKLRKGELVTVVQTSELLSVDFPKVGARIAK